MSAPEIPMVEFEYAGRPVRMALLTGADHISSRISASRTFYEVEFLEALKEFLKPGDLVLDLGANIGNHTVFFAGIAGCKVMAFEPVAPTCDVLRRNVELNGLQQNVEVFQLAVGAESGTASIALFDDKNVGATRLRMDDGGKIEVTMVDRLDLGLPVRLIKIDVEGMDIAVVRGAVETLRKYRPVLACEAATSEEVAELVNVLAEQGYVAVACFNATDTYIFLPAGRPDESQLVTRYGFKEIIALQKEARRLNGRFAELGRYAERVSKEQHERAVTKAESLVGVLAEQSAGALAGVEERAAQALTELATRMQDSVDERCHEVRDRGEAVARELADQAERRSREFIAQSEDRTRTMVAHSEIRIRDFVFQSDERTTQALVNLEGAIKSNTVHIEEVAKELVESAEVLRNELSAMSGTAQELQSEVNTFHNDLTALRTAMLAELANQSRIMEKDSAKKMEELGMKIGDLESGIAASNAALLDAVSAKDRAAEAILGQMRELQDQLESARKIIAEHKRQLEDQQAAAEAMRAAKQQSEAEAGRLRERLQGELSEKTRWKQAAAQSTESARSSATQAEIYSRSITFQLGSAMQASLSSAVGIIKLPVRIYRILREWRRRRGSQADAPSDWRVVVPVRLPDATMVHATSISRDAAIAQTPAAPEQTVHAVATEAGVPSQPNPVSRGVIPRLPSLPKHADELRIAAIMDEFTYGSYGPCCDVQQLLPSSWREQLEAQAPHLLFIESAWQGKDGAWQGKVVHSSPELEGILAWCRERRIPTIFWNKEDPVHFETFVGFAQRFDHVFTTDIDCIGRYKAALGHDRVYLLPFACQPLHHNPIEKYQRKNAFCFAGAYYARYPERQKDFDVFIDSLTTLAPVEIYDRNFGKDHPDYMFPERYKELIRGNLAFNQIDVAYKGYAYAINLNSVKQSQTMFARRAFDLLGCNTLTVSNYSRGLRLMFGDLVVTTDSGVQLVRRLQTLLGESNQSRYRKFRLAGLRKILREHTYADRLSYILGKVAGRASSKRLPDIVVVARIENDQQLDHVLNSFHHQQYARKSLVLVTSDGYVPAKELDRPDVSLMPASKAKETDPSLAWPGRLVSVFAVDDYYGVHYLDDLALSTLYSGTRAVGKVAYFTSENGAASLRNDGAQYRSCSTLQSRRALIGSELVGGDLAALLGDGCGTEIHDGTALAIDEFNYVEFGASTNTWPAADDLDDLDSGLSMAELHGRAEAIEAQVFEPREGTLTVSGDDLIRLFGTPRSDGDVRLEGDGLGFVLASTLAHDKHHYVYAKELLPLAGWVANGKIEFHLEIEPGVSVELAVLFFDSAGKKLASAVRHACRNVIAEVPSDAVNVRLALRVKGSGQSRILRFVMGHLPAHSSLQLGRADHLLVTNQYPTNDNLYRNAFVHRRVKGYRELGLRTDVFCLRDVGVTGYHEFEDIDVTIGWKEQLQTKLAGHHYRTVLVHFLDRNMWDVLKDVIDHVRVIVWVHGSDIQHWERRAFMYDSGAEQERARVQSEARAELWREVLAHPHPNLHLVFVSRYLAETSLADLGVNLAPEQYSIIHNFIDGELFHYQPKSPEQRWRMLSIRPYASRVYANDLTVRTILALRGTPEFERMEFRLIGDGPLFAETLAPLEGLPNVQIEQRFLTQAEIAALHREYGVFLVPTRMDSQGVSRDEAMASGLVPLTNAVAAIPEFVDQESGLVAPSDDVSAMACLLIDIVRSPDRFQQMSRASAERTRYQCGPEKTLWREVSLIQNQKVGGSS